MRLVRERIEALIRTAGGWLAFDDPVRVVRADAVEGVRPALADVERLTRDFGFHAVGFVSYEAAEAFDLAVHPAPGNLPLVWFALFEPARVRGVEEPAPGGAYRLDDLKPSIDFAAFELAFARIKEHLAAGDTYQVNLTFKIEGRFDGDPRALFADLVSAQRGAHAAFLTTGEWSVCSASPELFFAVDGATIRSRPMKGTSSRGRTPAEDAALRDALRSSDKQRAENVMVVDMIRNDLGRVADVGSLQVPELFVVERYPNVWQMTSLVTGRTLASLEEIFAALHPSASVTGAPKVRTMEIVRSLEPAGRGVYTGSIGHVRPDGNASFNVAIRTAVVDHRTGTIHFGTGSGIVWDSEAAAEYAECLLKSSVLGRTPVAFELLETIRWSPDQGFFLLERHLARLRASADYFDVPLDEGQIPPVLDALVHAATGSRRVRLLVSRRGEVRGEETVLQPDARLMRVTIAAAAVDSRDPFLFHKTTNRAVYDAVRVAGFDDTILWNERGEVTEATTANVVVERAGRRVTPPVDSGLLAGTFRGGVLERGELEEGVILIEDLLRADRIWLINSVHEWRPATLAS